MPRSLPVLMRGVGVVVAMLSLANCLPPAYVQPRENEPHAVLKVRHIVHQKSGPLYSGSVSLNHWSIDARTIDDASNDGTTFHIRIRPKIATLRISAMSYHQETRMVQQARTVSESYSCSSYSCTGFGTSQRCGTTYSTCYRNKTVYETVSRIENVTDDACGGAVRLAPKVGGIYLLQFDYLGEYQCSLKCYEQTPGGDGEFTLSPCPEAPPPTEKPAE